MRWGVVALLFAPLAVVSAWLLATDRTFESTGVVALDPIWVPGLHPTAPIDASPAEAMANEAALAEGEFGLVLDDALDFPFSYEVHTDTDAETVTFVMRAGSPMEAWGSALSATAGYAGLHNDPGRVDQSIAMVRIRDRAGAGRTGRAGGPGRRGACRGAQRRVGRPPTPPHRLPGRPRDRGGRHRGGPHAARPSGRARVPRLHQARGHRPGRRCGAGRDGADRHRAVVAPSRPSTSQLERTRARRDRRRRGTLPARGRRSQRTALPVGARSRPRRSGGASAGLCPNVDGVLAGRLGDPSPARGPRHHLGGRPG